MGTRGVKQQKGKASIAGDESKLLGESVMILFPAWPDLLQYSALGAFDELDQVGHVFSRCPLFEPLDGL